MRFHLFTVNHGRDDDRALVHRAWHLTLWRGRGNEERSVWAGHIEVVIRAPRPEFSARFHVGTAGSETPWDGHLTILGNGVFWGHEGGRRLADRITREKRHPYEGRDLSLSLHDGRLYWRIWTHQNHHERGEFARWRERSIRVNIADILLGDRRYSHEDIAHSVAALVLPEGVYSVSLTLQRVTYGRPRGRKRRSWSVEWEAPKGIPTYADPNRWKGDRSYSSGVKIRHQRPNHWVAEALNQLGAWVFQQRADHGFPAPSYVINRKAAS